MDHKIRKKKSSENLLSSDFFFVDFVRRLTGGETDYVEILHGKTSPSGVFFCDPAG